MGHVRGEKRQPGDVRGLRGGRAQEKARRNNNDNTHTGVVRRRRNEDQEGKRATNEQGEKKGATA
jgi:hypothetical protein